MNRRSFLVTSSASLAVTLVGCLSHEEEPDADHSCPETWNVILYNETDETKALTVTIRDSEDQVVFSDTVDIEPNTDRSTGVELDVEVAFEQSYTFEAELSEGDAISREATVNCGNVYIFTNESEELGLQADDADH